VYHVGRFELFLDLLYVAILSNFADTLAEDISGAKLVKYIVSSICAPIALELKLY
jgi:low temperature requirement protein LtrA